MANRIEFVQKQIAKLQIKISELTYDGKYISIRKGKERDKLALRLEELETRLQRHVTKKHKAACNRQRRNIINQILDDE